MLNTKLEVKEQQIFANQEDDVFAMLKRREDEINQLRKENIYLKDYLESQNTMFKLTNETNNAILEQSEKQRRELEAKNGEINQQKNILEQMLSQLKENNVEMEMQKSYLEETVNELDKVHNDVTSSIRYAQRIQRAMLPSMKHLLQYVPECFILFSPKDLVSGDFYWYSIHGNKIIIAAVDCTGHGVPGALMSIIGLSLLNKVVNVLKIFSPEKILYALNLSINDMLNQGETRNRDGMDIAVCVIDKESNVLEYAGAHNSLVIIQNGELQLIKADRMGIGGFEEHKGYKFKKHTISLDTPTTFYIFSDGFYDQFGGDDEPRRFGSASFRKLLFEIHQKPMSEQEKILKKTYKEWIAGHAQLDDILIVGMKI